MSRLLQGAESTDEVVVILQRIKGQVLWNPTGQGLWKP